MSHGSLPPAVRPELDDPVSSLWRARAAQHTDDIYAGVPLSKFPEDLRVYEHLLWLAAPRVVIEIGAQFGGGALWLRDRLRTLAGHGRLRGPRVLTIDVDIELARETLAREAPHALEDIELIDGDVRDPDLPDRVAALLEPETPCMVIEDSAHVYETTLAALTGFARFVPADGFFVVEDGCVDFEELRPSPDWPRGVQPAIRDWLATEAGQAFAVRRDLELYGLTCHPGGFLQRRAA